MIIAVGIISAVICIALAVVHYIKFREDRRKDYGTDIESNYQKHIEDITKYM